MKLNANVSFGALVYDKKSHAPNVVTTEFNSDKTRKVAEDVFRKIDAESTKKNINIVIDGAYELSMERNGTTIAAFDKDALGKSPMAPLLSTCGKPYSLIQKTRYRDEDRLLNGRPAIWAKEPREFTEFEKRIELKKFGNAVLSELKRKEARANASELPQGEFGSVVEELDAGKFWKWKPISLGD